MVSSGERRRKMNKIYLFGLIVLLAFGLVASASYAADPGGKTLSTFDTMKLIGVAVRNPQGDFLGLVNEVIVDSRGQAFAVVNHGDYDIYGEGGVNTPVPIAALRISETKSGKERIVLNTDMEHMDFAPYYDPTQTNSPQYEASIDRYFGIQPSWTEAGACAR
jgi:hypothetical protein